MCSNQSVELAFGCLKRKEMNKVWVGQKKGSKNISMVKMLLG